MQLSSRGWRALLKLNSWPSNQNWATTSLIIHVEWYKWQDLWMCKNMHFENILLPSRTATRLANCKMSRIRGTSVFPPVHHLTPEYWLFPLDSISHNPIASTPGPYLPDYLSHTLTRTHCEVLFDPTEQFIVVLPCLCLTLGCLTWFSSLCFLPIIPATFTWICPVIACCLRWPFACFVTSSLFCLGYRDFSVGRLGLRW